MKSLVKNMSVKSLKFIMSDFGLVTVVLAIVAVKSAV